MAPPVTCTIIASNYLAHARVLADSLTRHHPGERLQVLIVDDPDGHIDQRGEPFDVLRPADLPLSAREYHELAACYEVLELATAIKPTLLSTLLLRSGSRPVLYLDPDILILSKLDELTQECADHPIVLTPHAAKPMARDGQRPTESEILASGAWNLGFIAVGEGAEPFLEWWADRVRFESVVDPAGMRFTDQRWMDLAPGVFDVHPLRNPGYNVAYWNADQRPVEWTGERYLADGQPLVFFHFSGFDPDRPYVLSKHQGAAPRVRLTEHPALRRLTDHYATLLQAAGLADCEANAYAWDRLPDGTAMTPDIRASVRRAMVHRQAGGAHQRPPDPFDQATLPAFMRWLASSEPQDQTPIPRLFQEIYRRHPTVRAAFPHPELLDFERFRAWANGVGSQEHKVPRAVVDLAFGAGCWPRQATPDWAPRGRLHPGFLVAGYLDSAVGVGEAARRALHAMESAGLPCGSFSFGLTLSPRIEREAPSPPPRSDLNTSVVWVNADELPNFLRAVGPTFFDGRYTIGHWVWETESLPESMADMDQFVDEIWTPSEYCRRAIQRTIDKPVLTVPHVITAPAVNPARRRQELGLPEGFVFLFVFDFLSTPARKNPAGLIEAFCRAFAPGEGPALVLKGINGSRLPLELERLRYQIGDRPDIRLLDSCLSPSDNATMLALADCYVSLHRAEGFGLTMAEAMALSIPVIATGYSGNLDFMHDGCAYLVPAREASVGPGATPYPEDHVWGEPDLDVAAELMRRVYESPEEARAVAAVGQREVLSRHGHAQAVRFLTAQFSRIQDRIEGGFESQVRERVGTFLAQNFAGRRRTAALARTMTAKAPAGQA